MSFLRINTGAQHLARRDGSTISCSRAEQLSAII